MVPPKSNEQWESDELSLTRRREAFGVDLGLVWRVLERDLATLDIVATALLRGPADERRAWATTAIEPGGASTAWRGAGRTRTPSGGGARPRRHARVRDPRRWPQRAACCEAAQLAERLGERTTSRLHDKDALDVFRLLRAVELRTFESGMASLLRSDIAGAGTAEALRHLRSLFATVRSPGTAMAVRATEGLADGAVVAASCAVLAVDLLRATDT